MAEVERQLPRNEVRIKGGRVVKVSEWVDWNGQIHECVRISRLEDGSFSAYIGDPEHGGRMLSGSSMAEAMPYMHVKIVRQYEEAFDLVGIDKGDINSLIEILDWAPTMSSVVFSED